mgnify:CR=1 FL=1
MQSDPLQKDIPHISVNRILLLSAFVLSSALFGQDDSSEGAPAPNPSAVQEAEVVETPTKTEPAKDNAARSDEPATKEKAPKEAAIEVTKQGERKVSSKSLFIWLPWIFAIVMSLFAGASAAYILVLRKQGRHFNGLRQKVIEGKEPVLLLSGEAARLISEFKDQLAQADHNLKKTLGDNYVGLTRLVQQAEESGQLSREQTHQTVETFKSSLNGMLEKINKFMQNVVQNTKDAHDQAVATKDYSKQVSELIHEKEAEISKLKEGYHLHLIKPLTNAFLKIRDEIHLLAARSADADVKETLEDLDRQIVAALEDMQIKETEIPLQVENLHARFWESLGAAERTDDPTKHGSVARIHERGYQYHTANSEPHVVKKAVVVVYNASNTTSQVNQDPAPSNSQTEPTVNTPTTRTNEQHYRH